jgi:hypothetical protein
MSVLCHRKRSEGFVRRLGVGSEHMNQSHEECGFDAEQLKLLRSCG